MKTAKKKTVPDLVRDAVDRGATSAEEIHKAIAHLPLDVLQQIGCLEDVAGEAKRIEDLSIGALYDLIRKINREVAALASDMFPAQPKLRTKHPVRAAAHAR